MAPSSVYSARALLSLKRPQIHGLSFVGFTFGCGAACLVPLWIWELFTRPVMQLDAANLTGKVVALPRREDIQMPIDEQLIVELYSK